MSINFNFTGQSIRQKLNYSPKVRLSIIIVAIVLILENLLLAYNNLQTKTPIFGLKLAGTSLNAKNQDQIKNLLDSKYNNLTPLTFSYQEKVFQVQAKDLGVLANKNLSGIILLTGRTGNIFQKIILQNKAAMGFVSLKLMGDISEEKLALLILNWQDAINQDPTPAMPDFKNDPTKIIPAKDGLRLNTTKLPLLVENNIFNPPKEQIPLPVNKVYTAAHDPKEITQITGLAKKLAQTPISIASGGQIFTLITSDIKSLLTVVERPDPNNPTKIVLTLRLDDTGLNRKLGEFATKVEEITKAEFDDHDARVAIYSQFYSGKRSTIQIPTGRNLALKKVLGANDPQGEKFVYLTFDDGPNSIYHPLILNILKAENIKATFFLVGQNTQKDSEIAKRTKAEGHVIGNHSFTHSFLPNLSKDAILKEIQITNDILKPFNNNQTIDLFRPPYGGVNPNVQNDSQQLNLKLTLWDVDPKDWSEPTTDELVRRVVSATKNGSNILLHSNHLATVKALPKIIQTLKSQGYSFKTLE